MSAERHRVTECRCDGVDELTVGCRPKGVVDGGERDPECDEQRDREDLLFAVPCVGKGLDIRLVVLFGSRVMARAHEVSTRSLGPRRLSSPMTTAAASAGSDVPASRLPQASEQYASPRVAAHADTKSARCRKVRPAVSTASMSSDSHVTLASGSCAHSSDRFMT